MQKKYKILLIVFSSLLIITCLILITICFEIIPNEKYIVNKYNQSFFDELYDYNCISDNVSLKPNYRLPYYIDAYIGEEKSNIKNKEIEFTDNSSMIFITYKYKNTILGYVTIHRIFSEISFVRLASYDNYDHQNAYILLNKTINRDFLSLYINSSDTVKCKTKDDDFYLEYNHDEFEITKIDNIYSIKALKVGNNIIKLHIGNDVIKYTYCVFDNTAITPLGDWFINNYKSDEKINEIKKLLPSNYGWFNYDYDFTGPTFVKNNDEIFMLEYDKESEQTVGVKLIYVDRDKTYLKENELYCQYKEDDIEIEYNIVFPQIDIERVLNYDVKEGFLWFARVDHLYTLDELINL